MAKKYTPYSVPIPEDRFLCTFSHIFAGGYSGGNVDTTDYITIATAGNATDFGNLLSGSRLMGSASDRSRAVFGGGISSNVIQYFTIATTGNATDFGDLTSARHGSGGVSGE